MKREAAKSKQYPVSKLVLVQQLQSLAGELKRTPRMRDITEAARQEKCASYAAFTKAFGTLQNALKVAKLPLNFNQEFTDNQLIAQLQDLSRALGRPLTEVDVLKASRAGTCARLATFKRVFGSPRDAFQKAGVSPTDPFERENLLSQYVALSKKLGRPATIPDLEEASERGECAGYHSFKTRFGGLEQTRLEAGFGRVPRRKFTKQDLIDQLKGLAKKLGRIPTADDVRKASIRGETGGVKTFRMYFGGHNTALREAGLEILKPSGFSRGGLISDLQKLAKQLGRRPSQTDVNRASKAGSSASAATYTHYFGSFVEALKAARLHRMAGRIRGPNDNLRQGKYAHADIKDRLRKLGKMLGRVPTFDDVQDASSRGECPNTTTIARHFGSFSAGLNAAGFDLGERRENAREQLKEQLRQLTRELRRIPTAQDIVGAQGRCATPMTFVRNFGSLVEARKAAGVAEVLEEVGSSGKPSRIREKYERAALIAHLGSLAKSLGKVPSGDDIRKACAESGGPGLKAYNREFGGVPAARKAANINKFLPQAGPGRRGKRSRN